MLKYVYWYDNHRFPSENNKVRRRYSGVNFFQNPHNNKRHPRAPHEGEVLGICCEVQVRYTFCRCHRSAERDIVINRTVL